MQQVIQYCDCCGKELVINGRKVAPYNGFAAEIYESRNGTGWGSHREIVKKVSMEVCDECHDVLRIAAIRFRDELNKIKNGIKHTTKSRFTNTKI